MTGRVTCSDPQLSRVNSQPPDIPRQPLRGHRHLLRIAQETRPHERLSARPESRARRQPDTDLVDDVEGGLSGIRHAVDGEEGVERAVGLQRDDAVGRQQRVAENVS